MAVQPPSRPSKDDDQIRILASNPAFEALLDRAHKLDPSQTEFATRYRTWTSDARAWTVRACKIVEGTAQQDELSEWGKQLAEGWDGFARTPDLQGAIAYLRSLVEPPRKRKRFGVALSFPGERRAFVKQIAEQLSKEVGQERVLYDKYYESEFARPDLDTYLQDLYHDESELIVVFLCADYERKEWCGLEWRVVRDLIKQRKTSAIMPLRFDNTEIPGLFSTDGYIQIDERSSREIADLIVQRMRINAGDESPNDHGDKENSDPVTRDEAVLVEPHGRLRHSTLVRLSICGITLLAGWALVVFLAWTWGEGQTLFQKVTNSAWWFSLPFCIVVFAFPFIMGRKRMQLLKKWKASVE